MKNNYNTIDAKTMQTLNQKQTVLIETSYKLDEAGKPVITDGKVEIVGKRIFLGNFCKRAEAYYDCFIAEGFKHRRNVQEYRLLKLNRAVEEVKDATYPVEYLKSENYKEESVKTAEPVSEPEQPQAEAPKQEVEEVQQVEAPKQSKKQAKKVKNTKKVEKEAA